MGRRPKAATEAAAAPIEAMPATVPIVRRRRRSSIVDHGAQAQILIDSLLRGRGVSGASQQEALAVVLWARGVHAEAEELKTLTTRVRRAKTLNAADRQVALTLNQTLLDGVLAGSLIVGVNASGTVSFRQAA
ncbi:hypothetical protein [Armatimonas sp.]|uniref:hypothetical protein n=1 Tax=Armatimonas sp. TaxID=1872638 RepID=UPI00374CED49